MTHRYSTSLDSCVLYIGDTSGSCHIVNSGTKELVQTIILFAPKSNPSSASKKSVGINGLLLIHAAEANSFFIVGYRHYKRKIAILQESN